MRRSAANWYCAAVHERSENTVAERLRERLAADERTDEFRVLVPQKRWWFKSGGVGEWRHILSFPGHIFVMTEAKSDEVRRVFEPLLEADPQAHGFLHYGNDRNAIALNEADKARLVAIYNEEFIAETLKVIQVGDRVEILDHLWEGLNGRILKVYRGKRRVLVEYELFGRTFTEMLGLEQVEGF